jgi:hypothetical protein
MSHVVAIAMAVLVAVQPGEDVEELALAVGLDPVELQGAVNTTGSTARQYLIHEGLLAAPWTVWDTLARCESEGRWHVNTGNGYYGGLQADMAFWRRYGGLAYAARPDLASREQQIVVATRGQAVQGWGAWPACSRRLGLR